MSGLRDLALAERGVRLAREGGVGQHQGDPPGAAHVEQRGAHVEVARQILLGRHVAADPEARRAALFAEALLEFRAHVAERDPGRVADDDIGLARVGGQPDRPREVAGDMAPDVVAAFPLQTPHRLEGRDENAPVRRRREVFPLRPGVELVRRRAAVAEIDHAAQDAIQKLN